MRSIAQALRFLRPRAIASVDKLARETAREVKAGTAIIKRVAEDQRNASHAQRQMASVLERQSRSTEKAIGATRRSLEKQIGSLHATVTGLAKQISLLELREAQLRETIQRDLELDGHWSALADLLADRSALHAHIRRTVDGARLTTEPLHHVVVDDALPGWLYQALLQGLPPSSLFGDIADSRRQLAVPFELAPVFSVKVWEFMAATVVEEFILPAVVEKFQPHLQDWLEQTFPHADRALLSQLPLKGSDGRILLRTRGYEIPPHRDPRWAFITCLLYLAKPSDDARWGTTLFAVQEDHAAPSVKPFWIPSDRCHSAVNIDYRPNRMLVFMNATGAHSAQIPGDAPVGLERFAYQFRVGPRRAAMKLLVESLPEDHRGAWLGKLKDY